MPPASSKFADVPLDEDTRIKSQRQVSIKGIDALHQRWVWDGITGESLIFSTADVAAASDQQIIEMACDAGLLTMESSSTVKRSESGFVFLNFGFDT